MIGFNAKVFVAEVQPVRMEFLEENIWVHLTDEEPFGSGSHVVAPATSEDIHSFIWRPREDYERGQLLVRFRESGVYSYDVPKTVFDEMSERALAASQTELSAFEWYDENIVDYVLPKHNNGTLYVEKHYLAGK